MDLCVFTLTSTLTLIISLFCIHRSDARGLKWFCPPSSLICQCHAKNGTPYLADCNNKNLRYIPKFKQKFQKLKFSGNNLTHLSYNTFINISTLEIAELYLNDSRIHTVEENAFDNLTLDFIDFSKNEDINITQLAKSFRNQKLKGLDLSGINLRNHVVVEFFNTNVSKKLEFVRLASCGLTSLTKDMFEYLINLKELDLSNNSLSGKLDMAVLPPVEKLVLKNMSIVELQTLSNYSGLSSLIALDVGYNKINNLDFMHEYGVLLTELRNFFADSNPLETLPRNTFASLRKLSSLSLCNITSNLRSFQGINSTTLHYLNFSNNIINKSYSSGFFRGLKSLSHLIMKDVSLAEWSDHSIANMLSPLCLKLKTIRLVRVYFQHIPSEALKCFRHLDILDLSSNNISEWQKDTFENVSVSKQLLMKNNLITVINATSFPEKLLGRKKIKFDFRGNPFSCTCEAHWFRNYLKGNYFKFRGSRENNYRCQSPQELAGTYFVEYDPSYEKCLGMNVFVIIALAICGALTIVMSLTIYLKGICKKRFPSEYESLDHEPV